MSDSMPHPLSLDYPDPCRKPECARAHNIYGVHFDELPTFKSFKDEQTERDNRIRAEAREAAIEECAKECDAEALKWRGARPLVVAADRIRALKAKKAGG